MDERLNNIYEEIDYLGNHMSDEISKTINNKRNKQSYNNKSNNFLKEVESIKQNSASDFKSLKDVSTKITAYCNYIQTNIIPKIPGPKDDSNTIVGELTAVTELLTELSEELNKIAIEKEQATTNLINSLRNIAQKNTPQSDKTIDDCKKEIEESEERLKIIEEKLNKLETIKQTITIEEYNQEHELLLAQKLEEQQKIIDNNSRIKFLLNNQSQASLENIIPNNEEPKKENIQKMSKGLKLSNGITYNAGKKLITKRDELMKELEQINKAIEEKGKEDWDNLVEKAYAQNETRSKIAKLEKIIARAEELELTKETIENLKVDLKTLQEKLEKEEKITNRYASKYPQEKPKESQEEKAWNNLVKNAYEQNAAKDRIKELEKLILESKEAGISQDIIDRLEEELIKTRNRLNNITRNTNRYANKFPQQEQPLNTSKSPIADLEVPDFLKNQNPNTSTNFTLIDDENNESLDEPLTGKELKDFINEPIEDLDDKLEGTSNRKAKQLPSVPVSNPIDVNAEPKVKIIDDTDYKYEDNTKKKKGRLAGFIKKIRKPSKKSKIIRRIIIGISSIAAVLVLLNQISNKNKVDENPLVEVITETNEQEETNNNDSIIPYYDNEGNEISDTKDTESVNMVPVEKENESLEKMWPSTDETEENNNYIYLEEEKNNTIDASIIGKTTTINNGAYIYRTMFDSYVGSNPYNPKYNDGTVIGVGIWNKNTGFTTVYGYENDYTQKINNALAQDGEIVSILISHTIKSTDELNPYNLKEFATGWHNIADTNLVNQTVNTRGV